MAGLFVKRDAFHNADSSSPRPLDRKWFPLVGAETVIGRSLAADIALLVSSVSRTEMKIVREGDAYYLQDLRSMNGTFFNGRRLAGLPRQLLSPGDEIEVGRYVFVFLDRETDPSADSVETEPDAAPGSHCRFPG